MTANSATDDDTLAPEGDLSITKTTNTSPVVPGSAIQYEIVVANSGPSTATGVDVDDMLPAEVTGATWSCAGAGGASCPNASGMGDIAETVDLPPGGSLTYTVDGTLDAGVTGSVSNTASLTVPAGFTDTNPGNESDTVMDTVDPQGDVAISKATLTSPVVPGANVQWQIAVTNPGPSDAIDATVTDTFPATVSGAAWTCAASAGSSCAASGNGNLNEMVTVASGGNVTFTVTALVDAGATGNLSNSAHVDPPAGFTDGSTGNDDSTAMDALVPSGDLSVSKTTLTSPVVAGSPVLYQIVVTNPGPSTVAGATVQDNFAATLSNETWTCAASAGSSCTASGMGDVLDLVTLLPGGTATYSVTADLDAAATGNLVNLATVGVPAGFNDGNLANNSFQTLDPIAVRADLVVSKTSTEMMVEPGDPITYNIVVTNQGPSDVTGVTVSDVFPAELTAVSWTCVAAGGATCTAGPVNGDINDVVDLPAGGSVTYTAETTAPDDPATVSNTASATLPAGAMDPTPGNAEATADVVVEYGFGVPTLSPVGLALLVLLIAGLGLALLRRRGGGGAVAALALLLARCRPRRGATGDRHFSTDQGLNADPPGRRRRWLHRRPVSGFLGDERDIAMRLISGAGTVEAEVAGGVFAFDADTATRGEAVITWDGNDDDAATLDPVGLGGVDLTSSGSNSGIAVLVDQRDDAGLELILRLYTDGSN